MRDYNKWLEDNLPEKNDKNWLKNWRRTSTEDPALRLGTPIDEIISFTSISNDDPTLLNQVTNFRDPRSTSCIGQSDCAVGFACKGGFCVPADTEDSTSSGGCGTGGTGTDDGFGCIEVTGTGGGCTTGNCGDDGSGNPGAVEYCCGDWKCDKDLVTNELKCECIPYNPGTCSTDNDCAPGYICSDGYCVYDFSECDDDTDCPEGYYCSGGFCLFDWTINSCNQESDCEEGYICIDGYCVYDYGACNSDEQCQNGEVCYGGFCTSGCRSDNECGEDEVCRNGFCVPGCNFNEECPTGEVCVGGFCYPGCDNTSDCESGQTCVDGYCQTTCSDNSDCPPGTKCVNGFCVFGCDDSSDCEEGEVCLGGFCYRGCDENTTCPSGTTCINGYCLDSCASNEECPDGQVCVGGYCVFGCRDDNDCPENFECVDGFCYPLYESCVGDYQCNAQELCIGGLCFPGPRDCTSDLECEENEVCLNGICTPYFDLPDCGTLDFTDCDAVNNAPLNCLFQSLETVYSDCFDGLQRCGDTLPNKDETQLIPAGGWLYKNSQSDWRVFCYDNTPQDPICLGPNPPPNCPQPQVQQCSQYCSERARLGEDLPGWCSNSVICSECETCNNVYCVPDDGPCYCPESTVKCGDCQECDKDSGACRDKPEESQTCVKTCEVCQSCSRYTGTDFYGFDPGNDNRVVCARGVVGYYDQRSPCAEAIKLIQEECKQEEEEEEITCDNGSNIKDCDCSCDKDCPSCYSCSEADCTCVYDNSLPGCSICSEADLEFGKRVTTVIQFRLLTSETGSQFGTWFTNGTFSVYDSGGILQADYVTPCGTPLSESTGLVVAEHPDYVISSDEPFQDCRLCENG